MSDNDEFDDWRATRSTCGRNDNALLPGGKLSKDETSSVIRAVSEWTSVFDAAEPDKVRLFDAVCDFYDDHGRAVPKDIVFCSHPAVPLIAESPLHPDLNQIAMANFSLVHHFAQSGAPAQILAAKFGRTLSTRYLLALSSCAMESLRESAQIRETEALFTWTYLSRLPATLENGVDLHRRLFSDDHTREYALAVDDASLDCIRARYDYSDATRMMGNYILLSYVCDRHIDRDDLPSVGRKALLMAKKEARFLKDFYASGGWLFLPLERKAFIVLRPRRVHLNEQNLLHSADGPAAVLSDGLELYRYKGIAIPPNIIRAPEKIAADSILREPNVEIRRLMIARKGLVAFINAVNPDIIDEDVDGLGNPRKLYSISLDGDEPVMVLHVVDPAKIRLGQEPDVFLRVPPGRDEAEHAAGGKLDESERKFWDAAAGEMTTCEQAVAWTFGFQTERYAPLIES